MHRVRLPLFRPRLGLISCSCLILVLLCRLRSEEDLDPRALATFTATDRPIDCLAFSPSGARLATVDLSKRLSSGTSRIGGSSARERASAIVPNAWPSAQMGTSWPRVISTAR